MAGSYQVWLTDDYGLRLLSLDTNLGFDATRRVNGIGWINIRVPATFDTQLLNPDRQIQIWRQASGGALNLWQVYFIRKWKFLTSQSGEETIWIAGPDINDILRRRIVLGFSGTSYTLKTNYADDMMKEILTESLSDSISPIPDAGTRVLNDLTIESALSDGPSITVDIPGNKLLTNSNSGAFSEITKAAKEAGTEVFFDIRPNIITGSSINYIFKTYINQPGLDVTDRVVFDQQRGNLKSPELEFDYSEEENYIYSFGKGEGEERITEQVYNASRYGISQWNRCEGYGDYSSISDSDALIQSGRKQLRDGLPRRYFTAIPVDTKGTKFGRDWDIGYKVKTIYKSFSFDSIIKAVTIHNNNQGRENIEARLEYE